LEEPSSKELADLNGQASYLEIDWKENENNV
jgi:hypothetical protein